METSYRSALLRSVAAAALFSCAMAGAAQAQEAYGDGHFTGFSVYGGGGMSMFNTGVKSSVTREDALYQCADLKEGGYCPTSEVVLEPEGFTTSQKTTVFSESGQDFNLNDLGADGGFGTVGAAYDFRIAPGWTLGACVDADWFGGMNATATHRSGYITSNNNIPIEGYGPTDFGSAAFFSSKAEVDLNWDINVGGKLGWRAWPNTLLYFLAAYTHADLDSRVNMFTNAWFVQDQIHTWNPGGCEVFTEELGPPTSGGCPIGLRVKGPDSADGFTLGFGGETQLGNSEHWFVRGEGRWTHLDLSGGGEDADHRHSQICANGAYGDGVCYLAIGRESAAYTEARFNDMDVLTARVALVYRFGGGGYVEPAPLK